MHAITGQYHVQTSYVLEQHVYVALSHRVRPWHYHPVLRVRNGDVV